MQRYFINKEQFTDNEVIITGDDVHHISKVLRGNVGDKIICVNGEGYDVYAEIVSIEPKRVVCRIADVLADSREPQIEVLLAQALPKSDKMDLIIQKGTEIGVTTFLPFTSERTIVQLNDKKEQKRVERWEKIAKEAAEQAHRSRIPKILPLTSLKQLLSNLDGMLPLIAYEKEDTNSLNKVLTQNLSHKKILLIIGPEGGFTEKEISLAEEKGAISISLGKRILRTETAGIVGAANIIYQLDEC